MSLPYDMGNAGDLLKHGVLAEFVLWRCESPGSLRFIDLFAGEPWAAPVPEVAGRVRNLPGCALRAVQTDLDKNLYYGSGLVARRAADVGGVADVRVVVGDRDPERRRRLKGAGLAMIEEDFPDCAPGAGEYDGYAALGSIAGRLTVGDLVLIDPFADFLPRAGTVVPQLAKLAEHAAVLLFVLNLNPCDRVARRFDALLDEHLPGAWRLTCPPLPDRGVRGESVYHAEVVLAPRSLPSHGRREEGLSAVALSNRLTAFAEQLSGVLEVPARQLAPRVVGADGPIHSRTTARR